MSNVAACVRRAGGASLSPEQFDRAMTLYQTVLQVTTTNPNPLTNPNRPNLSCVRALPTLALTQQPNTNKTLPTALQRRTQHLGRGHPHTLSTLFCLGSMLVKAGRHADAEPLLSECLAGRRVLSMPARSVQRGGRANSANDRNDIHDSDTREALTALAGCLAHLRRFEAARPLLEEALEGQRRAVARREGRIDADPMAQRQGLEPVAQRQGREPVEHEQGLGPGPVAQEQVPVALGQGPVPPEAQVQGLEPVPQEQGLGPATARGQGLGSSGMGQLRPPRPSSLSVFRNKGSDKGSDKGQDKSLDKSLDKGSDKSLDKGHPKERSNGSGSGSGSGGYSNENDRPIPGARDGSNESDNGVGLSKGTATTASATTTATATAATTTIATTASPSSSFPNTITTTGVNHEGSGVLTPAVGVDTSTVASAGTGVGVGAGAGTVGVVGVLTPTVRSNIASRSKEALQRHQERMEKRRLEKLQQQYQQLPNEQSH